MGWDMPEIELLKKKGLEGEFDEKGFEVKLLIYRG
jgi:hypothetical protein